MDDNIINQNQNFYIPQDDQSQDSLKDDKKNTQDSLPNDTNQKDINIHDPYDFILGNAPVTQKNDNQNLSLHNDNDDGDDINSGAVQDINVDNNPNTNIGANLNTQTTNPKLDNNIIQSIPNVDILNNTNIHQDVQPMNNMDNTQTSNVEDNLVSNTPQESSSINVNGNIPDNTLNNTNVPQDVQPLNNMGNTQTSNVADNLVSNAPQGSSSINIGATNIADNNFQDTRKNTYVENLENAPNIGNVPSFSPNNMEGNEIPQTNNSVIGNNNNSMPSQSNQNQNIYSQVNIDQNTVSNISSTTQTESIMGIISYVIGVNIVTLIVSFVKNDKFIKFHSLQGIFFDAIFLIVFFVFRILSSGFLSLGFLIANVILFIIWILLSIFLMYKAFIGDKYSFTFLGKFANIFVK